MSAYLRGTGTANDPYVIHDASAMLAFFSTVEPCFKTDAYFDVVANINCGDVSIPTKSTTDIFKAKLNLNGHTVSGLLFANYCAYFTSGGLGGVIKNGCMSMKHAGGGAIFSSTNGGNLSALTDVKLTIISGKLFSYSLTLNGGLGAVINNVVLESLGGTIFGRDDTGGAGRTLPATCYMIYPSGSAPSGYASATKLSGSAALLPSNYPSLDRSVWVCDGVSTPVTVPQARDDLTTGYAIKGITRVGNARKSRNVAILSAAYLLPVWNGVSNDDGSYFAPLYDYFDAVIPMHYDDYGFPLKTDAAYFVGDVIHPKTPNGYRYVCEQAGVSGQITPDEPWSVEVLLIVGTAKFRPKPIYEPKCLGPIYPGKANLVTGERI